MRRGKYLLLLLQLAAHVLLCGCENQEVSMFPNFKKIYLGDLFFLKCPFQGEVKWFHDDVEQSKGESLKIPAAARRHSGTYRCQGNGANSNNISVTVHDLHPRASLMLKTGQPVMQTGGSVTLRLDTDEGLEGWSCFVLRKQRISLILLKFVKGSMSIEFQTNKLMDLETIFWCANKDRSQRSNQVVLRTSDKDVSMEIYFAPVMVGDPLTLMCLHWDMEKISHVLLYKDGKPFENSSSLSHRINSVAETDQGGYKCEAIIPNKGTRVSDVQQLFVKEEAMRAVVSGTLGLSCSCPDCSKIIGSMWFEISEDSLPLEIPGHRHWFMIPDKKGTYACIAVHDLGKTLISKDYPYDPAFFIIIIFVGLVCVVLFMAGICWKYCWKQKQRRSNTGPVYEDVMLKSKEDDRYERLRGRGAEKEREYDTLQPAETEHVRKEGHYQPLAKAAMTEGVYHTLGMEGEENRGAAEGYEALQRKTMKAEIYHTLGMEGAASGEQN